MELQERREQASGVWFGIQDANFGNSSKPCNAEVPKGVENRSCGSRFFCTWSSPRAVTFSLNAANSWRILLFFYSL